MAEFEFFRIFEDGLYDFKPYITGNIFEQLMQLDDFEEQLVVCVGAVADGRPIGALAAQLLTGNEIFMYSIVVDPAYQRMGVGRGLIRGILSEACEVFADEYSIRAMPFRVFLHTDYALPENEIDGFEKFLQAVGFRDFYAMEDSYCIYGEKLGAEWFEAPSECHRMKIASFTEQTNGYSDEVSAYLMNQGVSLSTDHAFMSIAGEELKTILAAEYGMDNEYNLRAVTDDDEDIPEEEYLALLKNVLCSLKAETPDFLLIADGHTNINTGILKRLAEQAGTVYLHREAGFYGEFNT